MQTLRNWEYYGMGDIFTDLYEQAKSGGTFNRLYDLIISKENILLAYRNIKSNKGSKTPGTDKKTIEDFKAMNDSELVDLIRKKLMNYQPKQVRRVFIPKPNGKSRPLGIPCILDRIIQQCFKQILEPIAESKFYDHSYGFRPLRSAHDALYRVWHLVTNAGLHFVVDIDIKGFFDNVNHTKLVKQIWNMGIRDKKVLKIISKMLKTSISGEGIPSKGTPQGGILSPLLSNIVLNDLDQWVAGQWEKFETNHPYTQQDNKVRALKTTNLKEGYIVRYADDFKILCRDWRSAQKWYYAVKLYLKDRLNLEISPEKSKIVNLRKHNSEFLGFTIKTIKKGDKRVARTGITSKAKLKIKKEAKKRIYKLKLSPTPKNALEFNSFVLGIHNYYKKASIVNIEFSRLAFDLKAFTYNRLRKVSIYGKPKNPPPTYSKFYRNTFKTYRFGDVYLYPIADVKMEKEFGFNPFLTLFTTEGRELIHKKLRPDIMKEVEKLLQSNIPDRSVEYMDNRISRYCMKMGKCEITGMYLYAADVHCHHYLPVHLGGKDQFDNLRILHKDIHKLIHMTNKETIATLIDAIGLTDTMVNTINRYRKKSNLELIDIPN